MKLEPEALPPVKKPAKAPQAHTSPSEGISVVGAREHNLKNISLLIPRNQITTITGLSGSGKSSLAFDTIYAEGQRRYVESLSAYARNFLQQLKKPEVDSIRGLSPAIAIDQKSVGLNPRSTVGTVTEVYDFLRLLFAKLGTPECPEHHVPVTSQKPSQIVEDILKQKEGSKFYVLAPMAQGKKGEFLAEFQKWAKKGFVKARVDGVMIELEKAKKLAKTKAHDIDLVVDQLIVKSTLKARLSESINTALTLTNGFVTIENLDGSRKSYSIKLACPICGFSFRELEPRFFSFNNPRGACETCNGLGTLDVIEEEQVNYSAEGGKTVKGLRYRLRHEKQAKDEDDEELMENELNECPSCHGARLKKEVLSVKIKDKNIAELSALSAEDLYLFFKNVTLKAKEALISEKILKEICSRLDYMIRVGTGYLSLDRTARTLSGGEAQRIRLATQVGSALVGVLYVMDEPSIGLHARDHHKLLGILRELKTRGNTILLVEHDEETILSSDFVVDLGPRAGRLGGELLAQGTPDEIKKNPRSLTGRYLSGDLRIPVPETRRKGHGTFLKILNCSGNNLKNVDLALPLGALVSITGVSGSGKSTLIIDTLYKILARHFNGADLQPSPYSKVEGLELIDRVIQINQKPIGRTPRSTPATYVGLFPMIRDLFANLPESKLRGYPPGYFSFNVKGGGRCEACQGQGQIRVEMHFLSDVFVKCDTCQGRRYNRDTLNITYKGKSIADVLAMTVGDALEFFTHHRLIHRKLETLNRVGLDYMTLGQSSTTLSGGEAQRVKLSRELSKRGTGKTLYILDEPTTGLHFDDIKKLVELLHELVEQGNTVVVIEHNLDVVLASDYVIDLGPEGGSRGGEILCSGTPEGIMKTKRSFTGAYLAMKSAPQGI